MGGKFPSEKVERRLNIALFTQTTAMRSRTQSRAAKIEAQNWNAEGIKGFGCLVDDFVVHRPPKKWMRMANDGGKGRRDRACGSP